MFTEALLDADFKTAPFDHQLIEFEKSAGLKERALLWTMRTGKTKLLIDTACHLYKDFEIDAVLLIAPNGIHDNWIRRELPVHHWDTVPHETLTWVTSLAGKKGKGRVKAAERELWQEMHDAFWAKAKSMMKTEKLAWFSFNSESIARKEIRNLIARIVKHRRCLIIFDESDDFRTPGSTRTKMVRALAKRCPYRRIATGSVVTNSPLAAFSQFELLKEEALGFSNYGSFKDTFATYETKRNRNGRSYPVLVEYTNLDLLRSRMAPYSSVINRDDIKDMPPLIRSTREIELTPEQIRIYKELHEQFTIEVNEEEVSIGENAQKLAKLQQVVSGFLIDEYGDLHEIPGGNPRLDAVSDECYLSSGKVIIWCKFQKDIDLVAARLRADGRKVVEYHGRVSSEDKVKALNAFKEDPEVTDLVGQPQAGGRGLNMSEASKIIWYSHMIGHAIIREQADERATAIGGGSVNLVDFVAKGVDEYAMDMFASKFEIADDLARTGMKQALLRTRI